MRLYLIRHPKIAAPEDLCIGRSEWPLAEDPQMVAESLRSHLPEDFVLYSSPSARAAALARALSAQPRFDERLLEIHFGEWENQPFDAIPSQLLERWARNPFGFQPPGGESAAEMALRTLEWWNETRERELETDALVVVAHAGPLKALLGYLLGLARERWLALAFSCSRSSCVVLHPWGGVTLEWFNR